MAETRAQRINRRQDAIYRKIDERRTYLVIGIYRDDHSRFAESYAADSPDEAEQIAEAGHPNLIVAAVINEEGQVVQ